MLQRLGIYIQAFTKVLMASESMPQRLHTGATRLPFSLDEESPQTRGWAVGRQRQRLTVNRLHLMAN